MDYKEQLAKEIEEHNVLIEQAQQLEAQLAKLQEQIQQKRGRAQLLNELLTEELEKE